MTRNRFLQTVGGAAASAYLSKVPSAAAAKKPRMKLGASAYSYTLDLRAAVMTLEDVIADVADMGAEGLEILGESHVPNYPNPPSRWVDQWFEWMEKHGTKPSAYDLFVDTMLYKDRRLTVDEAVSSVVRDLRLANRLGFKVVRYQMAPYPADNPADQIWAPYALSTPAMQVVEKSLPFAEQYDVKLAVELHSPARLKSPWVEKCLELITRTKTRHFGFCPDMSANVARPPRHRVQLLLEQGVRQSVIDFVTKAYQDNLGIDKTVAQVKKMGGNEAELRWAGRPGMYHFSNNDPKDYAPLAPYCYHVHAKFYEMTDDLREYSIPGYEEIIRVLARGGYEGYWSSEYEGRREDFQTSAQIRLQHAMLRRVLAGIG